MQIPMFVQALLAIHASSRPFASACSGFEERAVRLIRVSDSVWMARAALAFWEIKETKRAGVASSARCLCEAICLTALALSGDLVTIARFSAVQVALARFTKAALVHVEVVRALVAPDTRVFFFASALSRVNVAGLVFESSNFATGAIDTIREGVIPSTAFFALGAVESVVAEAGERAKRSVAKVVGCSIF